MPNIFRQGMHGFSLSACARLRPCQRNNPGKLIVTHDRPWPHHARTCVVGHLVEPLACPVDRIGVGNACQRGHAGHRAERLDKRDVFASNAPDVYIHTNPLHLNPAEQQALEVVRQTMPGLAEAYDVKEAFFQIYDEPDKSSAIRAFTDWENALPTNGLQKFCDLAKTVHNHYEDIFAYWDAPRPITNAYTECLNGLTKLSNRLGRGYSYEMIRAKVLYAKYARKAGSGVRWIVPSPTIPTSGGQQTVEYGPHIPTLVEMADEGGLD